MVYNLQQATELANAPPTNFSFETPSAPYAIGPEQLTDALAKRFVLAPELLNEKDSALLDKILSTITDMDQSDKIKTDSGGSGRQALLLLFREKQNLSASITGTIRAYRDQVEAVVIESPDREAFSALFQAPLLRLEPGLPESRSTPSSHSRSQARRYLPHPRRAHRNSS